MKDRESRYPGRYRAVMNSSDVSNMQSGKQFNITLVRDDDPVEPGTPFSKETILPDSLCEQLGVDPVDMNTPADFLWELVGREKADRYDIDQIKETLESLGPGGGITDEELATKVEDIVVTDLIEGGSIRAEVYSVAEESSDAKLKQYKLIHEDESASSGYSSNVVTKEQHDKDILGAKDYALDEAAAAVEAARIYTDDRIYGVYEDMYTKTEVDAKIGSIETALDSILAIQNELIGGDGV